jgi:hypothetical protein
VSILLGNGDGTFRNRVNYSAGNGASLRLAVGDFNGDGSPDLAVTYQSGSGVGILLGNGDGTFDKPAIINVSANFPAVGDFNGDGKLDLALATNTGVAILLGTGSGSLQPPALFGSIATDALVGADFNGDGKLDLAATQGGTSKALSVYRLGLEILAKKNKLEKNVIFYNQFVDLEHLKEFIGAADLYITPYLNEAQITSGTLAYTFGAGKAVVSTPYWHAAELLAEDRGVLVPFGDAPAIAREVIGLLRDDTRRHAMRKNAYRIGREMVWSNVAQMYMRAFECSRLEGAARSRKSLATKTLDQKPRELPELKLSHLLRMTDSTGLFRHAIFSIPNVSEGYCTDDNARAFILAVLLSELGEDPERVRTLATTYAAFLHHAFDLQTKRFHNHLSFDRRWLDEQGSEDCQARALWALGVGVGRSPYRGFQAMAGQLFALVLPALTEFTSPRAWAIGLIGIHEYLRRLRGDSLVTQTRETLTSRLMELFERTAQPDWCWFEEDLSYDNAKLAHALILSGRATGQQAVFERGLQALRWLTDLQMSEKGHFRPIGSNGFYRRGGTRANFDQQPIEAQATVSACLEAYRATSDFWWHEQAERAFDWFIGWNDLGLELYSPRTGGCRDGLHVDRVNRNQGAESTLAFLLSLAEMRLAQNMLTSFKEPIAVEE